MKDVDPDAFGRRVASRRLKLGLSQGDLAEQIGMRQQGIDAIEKGKVKRPRLLRELSSTLRTTDRWLLWREGPEETRRSNPGQDRLSVPLVGHVGAGAETHFAPGGELGEVDAPDNATAETVAVEIRGDSLGPLFDRWLVFYDDVRRPVTTDLIGRLCVVGLDDGRILIKKLHRSKSKGLYHLISHFEEPILDVSVEWAAKVKNMVPR